MNTINLKLELLADEVEHRVEETAYVFHTKRGIIWVWLNTDRTYIKDYGRVNTEELHAIDATAIEARYEDEEEAVLAITRILQRIRA